MDLPDYILRALIDGDHWVVQINISNLIRYCEKDCESLAHIINIFTTKIFERFGLSIHEYPTLPSLSMGIFRTYYLENNNLIPLISGEIYENISKAYHGGHNDVYEMYSNEDVHSYDYTSMYPTQMFKHSMPVGKITEFEGNPLKTGETLKSLSEKLAFIKCSIYVDKSIKRPLYQTLVRINGEMRSVCATGTFLNQWVFTPDLLYYEQLTNGKIKIIPESIKKGYLFESKIVFKEYIKTLFDIKNSVNKQDPWYQISKILIIGNLEKGDITT
jgi:hypothetical protein